MTSSITSRFTASLVILAILVAACTPGQEPEAAPAGQRLEVTDPSADHTLRHDQAGLVVPADVIQADAATLTAADGGEVDHPLFPGSGSSETVVFESSAEFSEPVTVELAYDPADYEPFGEDVRPVMYVQVEELGTWVPVRSMADTEEHVVRAETTHLSRWGLGAPLYLLGRLTGDRAEELECGGPPLAWVDNAGDVEDINASVFGCVEADGDAATIRIRSNRGSPILLEMNAAMEVVGGDTVSREFTRAVFGVRAGGVFLAPKETIELRLEQPETTTNYEVRRAGSPAERAALYLLHFLLEHVGDGTLAIDLAKCATQMLGRDLEATAEAAADLVEVAQSCIEPRLELWRSTGVISNVTFSRLSDAFTYFKLADELVTALDASLVDATADLVYHLLAKGSRKPGEEPPAEDVVTAPEGGLQAPAVMLVVDVSGSMREGDGTGRVKLDGAREAIVDFADRLPDSTYLGVRTYPGTTGGPDGCSPGSPAVPLAPVDPTSVSALVNGLAADGDTPTSAALEAAAQDLRRIDARAATIVLISDGQSNCGPSPCDTAQQIAASGIDVSVNTIGFKISQQGADELECIAKASNGIHVDVDNSAELIEQTALLSQPSYTMTVHHPSEVASATAGSTGEVTIEATVTSNGATAVRDGQVFLQFGPRNAPGVVSPRRRLGNLAPGVTVTQRWTFNTPLDLESRTLTFEVVATGDNIAPKRARGTIEVEGDVTLADTGPILQRSRNVVILGDSFSSGEGVGEGRYLDGTHSGDNRCHRSMDTYGRSLWGDRRTVLACSGAVTVDMWYDNHSNQDEPPQINQLKGLETAPDLVLLTLGGNDIRFKDIIEACVRPGECHEKKVEVECLGEGDCGLDEYTFEQLTMDRIAGLPATLRPVYRQISHVVNSAARRHERGRIVPIVVVAYPSIAPRNPSSRPVCAKAFSPTELSFANRVVDALNGAIEQTATTLRETEAIPVYVARDVQRAFLPDHTYCDETPFVNQIGSAGLDILSSERRQELVHPNVAGYRAMTAGLARWSVTETAQKPVPSPPEEGVWSIPPELGDPAATFAFAPESAGATLRTGETYEVTTTGHVPGGAVELRIASAPRLLTTTKADDQGQATLRFAVPPDVAIGRHHLEMTAENSDASLVVSRLPVRIQRKTPPIAVLAGALALLALAAAVILRRRAGLLRSPARSDRDVQEGSGRGTDPA